LGVLTLDLALRLREAGLRWKPAPGDRFVLPHRGMDDDVFVLSDMTVEVHDFPTGSVIGFNGVTEWALDSVEQQEAVWLPAEHQLRDLLGGLFVRLERTTGDGESAQDALAYEVTVRTPDGERRFSAALPALAYAEALLDVLDAVTADGPESVQQALG
jgi:hypothetical protein